MSINIKQIFCLKEIKGKYKLEIKPEWLFYMYDTIGLPIEISEILVNSLGKENLVKVWSILFSELKPEIWKKYLLSLKQELTPVAI